MVKKEKNSRVKKLITELKFSKSQAAIDELVKIGAPVIPALIEVLKDEDPDVRTASAVALGAIGNKSTTPALKKALKDKDKDIRRLAGMMLKRYVAISEKSEIEALLEERLEEVKGSIAPTVCVILGIIGIFCWLIPGIIFFVIAAILNSSKKNEIHELELRLLQEKEKRKNKK